MEDWKNGLLYFATQAMREYWQVLWKSSVKKFHVAFGFLLLKHTFT